VRRGIGESGREPDRAGIEARRDQIAHPPDLGCRRRTIEAVHGADTEGRVTNHRRGVDRCRLRRKLLEVVREVRVTESVLPADQVERRRDTVGDERGEADAAVPGDHGGHALADLRRHLGQCEQQPVVVRVHVDEARRDHVPGGVELNVCAPTLEATDRGDAVAGDRDVAGRARRAAAVDDGAVADERVATLHGGHSGGGTAPLRSTISP
jgi:hypothetical protein